MIKFNQILVTNDDGINSLGLKKLVNLLQKYTKEIIVVAPKHEMSATSQKLTLTKGLEITKINDSYQKSLSYQVSGTPADCLKVAIHFLKIKPDIVFSGCNNGFNVGTDIPYSGTIGACFEASLYNIKSIALSCKDHNFYGMKYFDQVMNYINDHNLLEEAMILNINLPDILDDIKLTKQGILPYETTYEKKEDGLYYVNGIPNISFETNEMTDVYAVYHNIASISPLTVERTDLKIYQKYHNQ